MELVKVFALVGVFKEKTDHSFRCEIAPDVYCGYNDILFPLFNTLKHSTFSAMKMQILGDLFYKTLPPMRPNSYAEIIRPYYKTDTEDLAPWHLGNYIPAAFIRTEIVMCGTGLSDDMAYYDLFSQCRLVPANPQSLQQYLKLIRRFYKQTKNKKIKGTLYYIKNLFEPFNLVTKHDLDVLAYIRSHPYTTVKEIQEHIPINNPDLGKLLSLLYFNRKIDLTKLSQFQGISDHIPPFVSEKEAQKRREERKKQQQQAIS